MSEKTELLNFIYKNANMGETAMPMVIGMVTRPDLRAVLSSCLMDYRAVGGAAKETMRRCGHRGEDPGAMKKGHDENGFALERAAFSAAAAHCRNDDPRQHHGCYPDEQAHQCISLHGWGGSVDAGRKAAEGGGGDR